MTSLLRVLDIRVACSVDPNYRILRFPQHFDDGDVKASGTQPPCQPSADACGQDSEELRSFVVIYSIANSALNENGN